VVVGLGYAGADAEQAALSILSDTGVDCCIAWLTLVIDE
jgi:hypothetical protein